MLRFVIDNFTHILPIALSGLIGLIIICERVLALVFSYPLDAFEKFFERVGVLIMKDRIPDAIALCEKMESKPVARVVRAGISRGNQPQELIEHGLQIAVSESIDLIQARTNYLATIANVATLFGLLGTIMGLVQSFEAVGAASSQVRSALLASGISTAMNASILGLAVAIPCIIAFSFLQNRANRLISQVDQAALRTLDLLQQRYFRATDSDSEAEEEAAEHPEETTFSGAINSRKRA